ncbi:hypothetical protein [Wolbachia endosymbiont of Brugia malayi]|uniref:hypothetical protein n=1 Tax=Wolbachia endosymbiont of Brugia malayi TaxID=80849 RepID=UPI00030930AB|nr:hypothetical protein [Wolbachia endosymbiont of Brugia malayi]
MFDQPPDKKQSGCSFLSVEYIFSMVMEVGLSAAVNATPSVILNIELAAELDGSIEVVH